MPLLSAYIVPHPPLIIPAVGQGREGGISATVEAYRETARQIAADKPELIIFFTPHGKVYEDYIHVSPGKTAEGGFARFNAPKARYRAEYDEAFISALVKQAETAGIYSGTLGGRGADELDHGVLIPIHFINELYADYKIVRVSISGLPPEEHYRFGQCVTEAINLTGRRAVIVASGDLSHKLTADGPYGYAPEGPAFDKQITGAMKDGDFLRFLSFEPSFAEKAAECGLRSFIMMAGAFDGVDVAADFMSYEGPFGVGYAVCGFRPCAGNAERRFLPAYERAIREQTAERRAAESPHARLARQTVEHYVNTGRALIRPADLPPEMLNARAGTFVSIKKDGRLRGCIGTTEPYRANIAEEIIGNAISAASRDPRFDPISADELPRLAYSVDVLSPPEPVDGPCELDAERYGVIVECGQKRGLLLPNLNGVDTVAEQIRIAAQKGGINPGERYTLSRFEVKRHT